MVILRPTRRLFRDLPPSSEPAATSDTALGDWYVNRLVVDRRPLLLLVSSTSLLSLLVPARDVRALPDHLPRLIGSRLRRLGVGEELIRPELAAMTPVVVAPTVDRSVMGTVVDFAKDIPYRLEIGGWDDSTLPFVEARLAETPCHAARRFEDVIFPQSDAPKLLAKRWHAV
jgi:Domain of unknown function (DUF6933)